METDCEEIKKVRAMLKKFKYLGTVISVIMVGLAILLGFSVRWMFKTWPNLAVERM